MCFLKAFNCQDMNTYLIEYLPNTYLITSKTVSSHLLIGDMRLRYFVGRSKSGQGTSAEN